MTPHLSAKILLPVMVDLLRKNSNGSACGPVIVPVFKTGGRQAILPPVGSTPTRFRHFSTTCRHANQFGFGRAPVPPWNGGCRWPSVTVRGVPLASIYRSSRHLHELVNRWASIITNPGKFLKAELATRAVNIQVKNRLSQNGSLLDRQLLACHSSENDKFEPSTATEAMRISRKTRWIFELTLLGAVRLTTSHPAPSRDGEFRVTQASKSTG